MFFTIYNVVIYSKEQLKVGNPKILGKELKAGAGFSAHSSFSKIS